MAGGNSLPPEEVAEPARKLERNPKLNPKLNPERTKRTEDTLEGGKTLPPEETAWRKRGAQSSRRRKAWLPTENACDSQYHTNA